MTYQDQLIRDHLKRFELAILAQFDKPSVSHAQELSESRHALVAFIKQGANNAA